MLCDHLEGWDREGGREMQQGGDERNWVLGNRGMSGKKMRTSKGLEFLMGSEDLK